MEEEADRELDLEAENSDLESRLKWNLEKSDGLCLGGQLHYCNGFSHVFSGVQLF